MIEGGKSMIKIIVLIGAILLSSCSHNSTTDQTKKPALQLYVFNCGENAVKDISLFSPGVDQGVQKDLVIRCYLIKHPKGTLMWDTGLSDSLVKYKDGLKVREGVFTLKVKKTLISQLEKIGVRPHSINYLAFSHMHSDHSGNANLFANSQVLMQKEEYDAALGKDPGKYSFDSNLYNKLNKDNVKILNGDYDVFGDNSVKIIRTIGHTPGHQSLYIDLPQTGAIVLSGDLYHFQKNREGKRVPSFNFNKEQTLESMEKMENFLKDQRATLWIQHDPDQAKGIKLSPHFYQ